MNIKNKFSAFTTGEKQETIDNVSTSELLLMTLILTEQLIPGKNVPVNTIIDGMRNEGYQKLASSIALRSLKNKNMIDLYDSYNGKTSDTYAACCITDHGEKWIINNKSLFDNLGEGHENGKNNYQRQNGQKMSQ